MLRIDDGKKEVRDLIKSIFNPCSRASNLSQYQKPQWGVLGLGRMREMKIEMGS